MGRRHHERDRERAQQVERDEGDAGEQRGTREVPLRVLGLTLGGVPVAFEVARSLSAAGRDRGAQDRRAVPAQLTMGAVGEDDTLLIEPDLVRRAHVSEAELAELKRQAHTEVRRRAQTFRARRARIPRAGRTVVVVDDGITRLSSQALAGTWVVGPGRQPRCSGVRVCGMSGGLPDREMGTLRPSVPARVEGSSTRSATAEVVLQRHPCLSAVHRRMWCIRPA